MKNLNQNPVLKFDSNKSLEHIPSLSFASYPSENIVATFQQVQVQLTVSRQQLQQV
jgi:hypothetical protein